MTSSAAIIARAVSLQASSRLLNDRAHTLTYTARQLFAAHVAIRRRNGGPWIGGGAPAPLKICQICDQPIRSDELVVSARARPSVHLLCWPVSRAATGGATGPSDAVTAGEPVDAPHAAPPSSVR
jgi:hypothetical protein